MHAYNIHYTVLIHITHKCLCRLSYVFNINSTDSINSYFYSILNLSNFMFHMCIYCIRIRLETNYLIGKDTHKNRSEKLIWFLNVWGSEFIIFLTIFFVNHILGKIETLQLYSYGHQITYVYFNLNLCSSGQLFVLVLHIIQSIGLKSLWTGLYWVVNLWVSIQC